MSTGARTAARQTDVGLAASYDGAVDQTWTLPFSASAVRVARAGIAGVLCQAEVTAGVVEDARLVVSELLANALRHARPLPDGTLEVRLVLDAGSIRIAVVDGGSATLPTLLHVPPMSIGGRGLAIVRTLTRDWGVHESRAGNTVFGVLALG